MNIQPTPNPRFFLAQSEKKMPTFGEHLKNVVTEAVDGWSASPRLNTALAMTSVVTGTVIHLPIHINSMAQTVAYAATAAAAAITGAIAAPALSAMAGRATEKLTKSTKIPPHIAQLGGKVAFAAATLGAACTVPLVAGWLLATNGYKAGAAALGAMRIQRSEKPQVQIVSIAPSHPELVEGSTHTEGGRNYHLLHELHPAADDPTAVSMESWEEAMRKLRAQGTGS